jgi:hypothetical protein
VFENEWVAKEKVGALQVVGFSWVITILQHFSPVFHPIFQPQQIGFSPVAHFRWP